MTAKRTHGARSIVACTAELDRVVALPTPACLSARLMGWPSHVVFVALVAGASSAACVHDVVLPDREVTATCGNDVVEPGEDCDVASPGCVECKILPTWTCTREACSPICGDGVVGGPGCADARREVECEMTGYWAGRQSTYLREPILGGLQVSSNWFFFRLEQEGDAFVVRESLDCGILVTGSATVRYTPSAARAILYASAMDGSSGRPARRGTSRPVPGGCVVSFDRWYAVRGAEDALLPPDFLAKPDLASLPPLPAVQDPATSTESPPGAVDPDGDGHPGIAFQIEGLVSGVRNSAQRDWKEFATPNGASVPGGALSFEMPGAFDLQENVLRVTECGTGCGLLRSLGRVATDIPPRILFSFVGKSLDGARVRRIARSAPRVSLEEDLATCARIRQLLPHDPSTP